MRSKRHRSLALLGLSACGGVTVASGPSASIDAGITASVTDATDTPVGPIDATLPPPPDGGPDACTDVQDDPLNCGNCGHDCKDGPCIAGTCGPSPRVLATGQAPTLLAVDADNVYWVNVLPQPAGAGGHSQIWGCAIAGCNDRPTVLWDGLHQVLGLAVEHGAVWWTIQVGGVDPKYGSYPNVMSCAVGGCSDQATTYFQSSEDWSAFAANGSRWYAADIAGVVTTCSLGGCGGKPATFVTDANRPMAMALNALGLYWSDDSGNLFSCPLTGCGAPALIGLSSASFTLIAVDDRLFYWLDPGIPTGGGKLGPITQRRNGGVYECPIAGCSGRPPAIAPYASWLGGGALTVDATDVYWSTEDAGGSYGAIARCAIGGCDEKPTAIGAVASQRLPTSGLAVDATNVYWTDAGRGAVLIASK